MAEYHELDAVATALEANIHLIDALDKTSKVIVMSDHQNLAGIFSKNITTAIMDVPTLNVLTRIMRFNFQLEFIEGAKNGFADLLSR